MPKARKRAPLGKLEPFKVARCRVCGCTDNQACPEGCWWVESDLCSSCHGRQPSTGRATDDQVRAWSDRHDLSFGGSLADARCAFEDAQSLVRSPARPGFTLPPSVAEVPSERDPRKDPVAGDVVANGTARFHVTRVIGDTVYYTEAEPPMELCGPLSEWREFSINDLVVKYGDAP